jgi:hypothetical protein
MRSLSDRDLLRLWEGGLRRHPLDRALMILATVFPEASFDQIADWPLGRRNRALIEMRSGCFGPGLAGWTSCACCGEKLEFELDSRVMMPEASAPETDLAMNNPIVVARGSFRLPTSRDLARVAPERDPRAAVVGILESCRITLPQSSDVADALSESRAADDDIGDSWTEAEVEEVGELMAQADPLAETRVTMKCPKCGHGWDETLDIVAFVWSEIEARAKRLMLDIHTLASAYGWTEREILSLGDNRRVRYVAMVQA